MRGREGKEKLSSFGYHDKGVREKREDRNFIFENRLAISSTRFL